jgi:uncharacterized metal-binding protein
MNIRPKDGCSCGGSDRALRNDGVGKMSCLIGVAAGVDEITAKIRGAGKILVIDGWSTECGKTAMDRARIANYLHLRLADLGMEKGKTPATKERIEEVVIRAAQLLA